MIFIKIKFRLVAYTFLLIFGGVALILGGEVTSAAQITDLKSNGPLGTLAQWSPYPYQPYPPGYYQPPQEPSGTHNVKPSGFIFIEVDPPDATVFIDGNKVEPSKDNTYEEGVLTGMHKVAVKKSGYQDYLGIVTVSTGATQRLTVRLKAIR